MTKDKLSKSCGESRLYDCLLLGEIYYKEKQYSKARKHFEVQCDLDGNDENEEYANNNGCYYMRKMSALGQGTDKNLFQAEKIYLIRLVAMETLEMIIATMLLVYMKGAMK